MNNSGTKPKKESKESYANIDEALKEVAKDWATRETPNPAETASHSQVADPFASLLSLSMFETTPQAQSVLDEIAIRDLLCA